MAKERRLGRGLEALLGRTARGEHASPEPVQPSAMPAAEPTPPPGPTEHLNSSMLDQAIAMNHHRPEHEPIPEPQAPTPRLYQAPEETSEATTFETSEPETPEAETTSETTAETTSEATSNTSPEAEPDVVLVDVHLIEPNPFQPRRDFGEESLNSLSESIIEHGLLQPLVVRRVDQSYQLIAGERRFRAAQKSGLNEVPVRVVEADDRRMTELAIVENLQRKDLNALEKAASFKQYMESHGATQSELAGRLKIDRSTIANLVRLLELPDSVKESLTTDRITQGHARALLPLGDEHLQLELCRRIETESLTVREVERLVKEMIQNADAEPLAVIDREGNKKKPTPTDDQLAALEQEFRMALGMKVKLTQTARGRGKLAISFKNHEEFERLRDLLLATDRSQEKAG